MKRLVSAWGWRRGALFLLLLALPLWVLAPLAPRERTLVFRDALPVAAPISVVLKDALRAGRLPEWNPGQLAGVPFAAIPLTHSLYPPRWAAVLLTRDAASANECLVAFHLLLLVLGGWLLARELGLSQGGALGVAFATALTCANLSITEEFYVRACWLPLGLACLLWFRRSPSRRSLAVSAAVLALCFFAGALQTLSWLVAIALLLWLLSDSALQRSSPASEQLGLPRRAACYAALGVLTLGLAAPLLLATAAVAGETTRTSGGAAGLALAEVLQWSYDPRRLCELLLPFPFGLPFPERSRYLGAAFVDRPHELWIHSLHLGAIPFLCALRALGPLGELRARLARARTLGLCLVVIGLVLACGRHTPLYEPLARSPYGVFRYPAKHLALFALGAALLAGVGLECFARSLRSRAHWAWLALPALTLGAVPLLGAWTRALAADLGRQSPADLWEQGASVALAQCVFLALAWALRERGSGSRRALALAILLGFAALPFARRLIFVGSHEIAEAVPPVVRVLKAQVGDAALPPRVYRIGGNYGRLPTAELSPAEAATLLNLATLKGGSAGLYGLESLHGLVGVESERYARLLQLATGTGRGAAPFLIGPSDRGGADLGLGVALSRYPARPRVEILDEVTWVPDADAAHARLQIADLDEVVAVGEGPEKASARGAATAGRVTRAARPQPERVELQVEVERPGLLVLRDAWFPGWSASVDGRPRELCLVDGAFMGLRVEPGEEQVSFVYRAPWLRAGMGVGALACGLALVLLVWPRRAVGAARVVEGARDPS